jgi:hypothetical protein
VLCRLALLLTFTLLALLLTACQASVNATATAQPNANPTGTLTPAGDVLRIDGATVTQVLIPATDLGLLYALTDTQLFAQVKGDWELRSDDALHRHYLVDPEDPERLFRGDHPTCGLDANGPVTPLQVSTDGGKTWATLPLGENVRPLAFDANNHDVLYGSDCGLVISTDGGSTWRDVNALPGYGVADVAIANARLLVIGSNPSGGTMLRAVDISDPDDPVIGDILLQAPGPGCLDVAKGRIIVGTAQGVSISLDGGATWANSRVGLEPVTTEGNTDTSSIGGVKHSADFGIQAILIDRRDSRRIFAGTAHGLFVSQDDGVTWVRYSEIPAESNVTRIQLGLDDADLYVTTSEGAIMVPKP